MRLPWWLSLNEWRVGLTIWWRFKKGYYKKRTQIVQRCDCGLSLTENEIKTNEKIAKETGSPKLNMCSLCWDDYCHHAETGE